MPVASLNKALIAALLFAVPALAGAQTAAPAGPPPPAPKFEIEPFAFLIGRWHGKGTFGPSGDPVASTMTFELASRTTMLVRSAEDAPNTYKYVALWSRERESNQLLMLMSSSLDGPALYRSTGWAGDRLVFEPKPGVETGLSKVRFTYVRKGSRSFELTYEFAIGNTWHLGDRQVFTKLD